MMKQLFTLFAEAGFELVLVGGAVRDLCRGQRIETLCDLDFATNAHPAVSEELLRTGAFPVFGVGSKFGTLGTLLDTPARRYDVQITTYRADLYSAGSRKPAVTFNARLEDDLIRRDFTMNAMAMGADGVILDPFGGQRDLAQGCIRTVRAPEVTFREDPLRMLRAARFQAQLGFTPHPSLAIGPELAASILTISHERWLQEMQKLLGGPEPAQGIRFLQATGVLEYILPEIAALARHCDPQGQYHHLPLFEHTLEVLQQSPPRPAVRWAALLHDAGKPATRSVAPDGAVHFLGHAEAGAALVPTIAERFRFDTPLARDVAFLVRAHQRPGLYQPGWALGAVRRFVREAGSRLSDLLDLCEADIRGHHPDVQHEGLTRLQELRERAEALGPEIEQRTLLPTGIGDAVMQHFRIPPGPQVGAYRSRLEQAVLDGDLPQNGPIGSYLAYLDEAGVARASAERS
jgi:poly(A) polymerase